MKLLVYRSDGPPIEIEGDRVRVSCGDDHFEMREYSNGLLVRIEEHKGTLTLDLAVFPMGGNSVRLKGGLR